MKILLLGANGQVGWELRRSLCILGEVTACSRSEIDLEDIDHLLSMLQKYPADAIVNAAAYTAVDKAESEPERAFRVNAQAVGIIAQHARQTGALLVHYSTDYVFDGTKPSPYTEEDIANPINTYGKSKLAGEQAIRASSCRHIIFRTSWVFAKEGNNFPNKILSLARRQGTVYVVTDQFGSPTSAQLIADTTAFIINCIVRNEYIAETYNLSNDGVVNRYEYAKTIIELAKRKGLIASSTSVEAINSIQSINTEQRPSNSVIDTFKLKDKFKMLLPEWIIDIEKCINQLQ